MGTRRALRTGRPGRPADRAADPAQANRRQLAVLAGQPPKRTPPPPPPDAPTTAYRITLGRIAQESYRLAAETVLAEVRRLQAMAEAYRADTEEDDKRAAEQNRPHTPEEKATLDVPESLDAAIVVLERRAKTYAESIDTDKITNKHAKQVETFNRGVTLRVLGDLGLNPIPDGSAMAKARDAWVRENAALIVSQPTEVAERCGQVVRQMVPAGSRWETIAKRLEEEQGIASRRAALIARDQVSKYNAELTKIQQKGAGIEYYMWQGAMDNRERPSHVALQGTVWSWDRPPPIGSPGEPIQCRCWASPVTSDDAKKFAVAWTPEELAARTAELGPTQREGPDATREQVDKRAAREVAAEVKLAQRRESMSKPLESKAFDVMSTEQQRVAFGQKYDAFTATLSPRNLEVIAGYTDQDFIPMNAYLRKGQEVDEETKRKVREFAKILDRSTVPQDVVTYRGTGGRSEVNKAWESGKLTPGAHFNDRGFLSTSLDVQIAQSFQRAKGGVILEIEVPKGSRGLYVGMREYDEWNSSISANKNESELLLQKGETFRVVSSQKRDGVTYVRVRKS